MEFKESNKMLSGYSPEFNILDTRVQENTN